MCKKLCALASLLVVLSMSIAAFAGEGMSETEERLGWAGEKFVRGATNLITGWLELPAKIDKNVSAHDCPVTGTLNGVGEGIVHGLVRTAAGVGDLVTSPLGLIKEDEKPMIDPPTLFEK